MKSKFFGNRQFYLGFLAIALPTMAQQFVTSFVSLVDNVMIGSLGEVALTAVSTANRFYILNFSLIFGLAGGASIFVAQYFGAKKDKEVQESFDITIVASLMVGFLFTTLLVFFPRQLLLLFTDNEGIIAAALQYLKFAKFTYIPFGVSLAISTNLRSVKIVKLSLMIGIVSVLTNTGLNYVLIYGNFGLPELGVEGAGLATLIARLVEFGLYLYCLNFKNYYFRIRVTQLVRLNFEIIGRMINKVVPLTINEIIYTTGTTVVFMAYMRTDEILVAGISIIDTIGSLLFVIFAGISSAVMVMIGNELGANELEKAQANSLRLIILSLMLAAGIGTIIFVLAPIVPLFYNLKPETTNMVITCLRYKSFWVMANGVTVCVFFILRSGGDTKNTFILDSGFMIISMALSTTLSFTAIELIPLYFVVEGVEFVKSVAGIYLYKRGDWIKNLT